jgi:hypothetical protein
MRYASVPAVDGRYWIAISLASVFGCNLGDFISLCSYTIGGHHSRRLAGISRGVRLVERASAWAAAQHGADWSAVCWNFAAVARTAGQGRDAGRYGPKVEKYWLAGFLGRLVGLELVSQSLSSFFSMFCSFSISSDRPKPLKSRQLAHFWHSSFNHSQQDKT